MVRSFGCALFLFVVVLAEKLLLRLLRCIGLEVFNGSVAAVSAEPGCLKRLTLSDCFSQRCRKQ